MTLTKKPNTSALFACAMVLLLTVLGLSSPAWSDYRSMADEVAHFHAFMRQHPGVSADLRANPRLVYNRNYLDRHDELRAFLWRHPAVREEIAQNPGRVFGRYYGDDRREYSNYRSEPRWDYRYGDYRGLPGRWDVPVHRENRANRDDRDHRNSRDNRNDRDNRQHRGDRDHEHR